ncbi:MAG TPA: NAD(P)-dependent oxidoreductase [Pyrinomonadaceae bacterium]|jgi:nucleoside-diphosphate-sugar epimerase|nr:NAD(P)-dependent oxidoreductase [Pyrinomonadaceae bacterium]
MNTLVTGGSGYLGTYVRNFFKAADFSRRSSLNILEDVDAQIVENYDVVIHLAGHLDKNPEGAEECFRTNADGTRNIIRHMREGSVFIYASTKDVYGAEAAAYEFVPEDCPLDPHPASAFELSKLIGERYVEFYARQRGVRACIFRMSAVFARPTDGNENGFVTHYVESVKHRWPIRLPAGEDPVRDILYVDDFSRACQAFINSKVDFGLYNLGGGRLNAVGLHDLIGRIGRMIEIEPVIEEDPNIPLPMPLRYVSDLTRIENELQWRPQIGIDNGLRVTF